MLTANFPSLNTDLLQASWRPLLVSGHLPEGHWPVVCARDRSQLLGRPGGSSALQCANANANARRLVSSHKSVLRACAPDCTREICHVQQVIQWQHLLLQNRMTLIKQRSEQCEIAVSSPTAIVRSHGVLSKK